MATRKPLVLNAGKIQQLQSGDDIDVSATSLAATLTNNEASVTIVKGQPVYIQAASAVKRARANAAGTSEVIGLALAASVAAAASGKILLAGVLAATTGQWDAVTGGSGGLTVGSRYYLDPATAGMLTTTKPTTAGQFVVGVGIAISTTEMMVLPGMPVPL